MVNTPPSTDLLLRSRSLLLSQRVRAESIPDRPHLSSASTKCGFELKNTQNIEDGDIDLLCVSPMSACDKQGLTSDLWHIIIVISVYTDHPLLASPPVCCWCRRGPRRPAPMGQQPGQPRPGERGGHNGRGLSFVWVATSIGHTTRRSQTLDTWWHCHARIRHYITDKWVTRVLCYIGP